MVVQKWPPKMAVQNGRCETKITDANNIFLGLCIEERISSPASVLSSTDQNFQKIRNDILNKKSRRSKRNQFHHRSDHDRNRDHRTWTDNRYVPLGLSMIFYLSGYPWKDGVNCKCFQWLSPHFAPTDSGNDFRTFSKKSSLLILVRRCRYFRFWNLCKDWNGRLWT